MPVTITLNTLAAGSDYFDGMRAERYDEVQVLGTTLFIRSQEFAVNQNGLQATLVFDNVPNGRHRFCIREPTGLIRWRSPILRTATGTEVFAFHVVAVPAAETTFDSDQFQREIEVPVIEDIPDLDEDLTITSLDVTIKVDHIDIDGEGKIAKDGEWTILKSDLDFDYDFTLEPRDSIDHRRFVKVVSFHSLTLHLENPVTGVGAWFLQDKIDATIRATIRRIIDKQLRKQLRRSARREFGDGDDISMVTATVLKCDLIDGPVTTTALPTGGSVTGPSRQLQLVLDASIPSSMVSSGGGCLGVIIFPIAILSALLLPLAEAVSLGLP
jgi:hypothetical protein